MVGKRDRILELTEYLESCGISVNIAKNKARGNKGFFKASGNNFRIDIAKGQSEDSIIRTLAHEFAHFVHYKNDKSLKNLDFIFEDSKIVLEELISATVKMIPKKTIKPLFDLKEAIKEEITDLKTRLETMEYNEELLVEKIKKTSLKHLLKYDRVKVLEGFGVKYYNVESLGNETDVDIYLKLLSKKRALKRLNSKMNRLNKYYNSPTELFARSFELYISDKMQLKSTAPTVYSCYEKLMESGKQKILINFVNKI